MPNDLIIKIDDKDFQLHFGYSRNEASMRRCHQNRLFHKFLRIWMFLKEVYETGQ